MKNTTFPAIILAIALSGFATPGNADAQNKQILEMTKNSWVAFRNFNGRQLIYFTHLESWKCGILQVKYSINSGSLDQFYLLQSCDPNNSNAVSTDKPYISLPLGTAQTITVQVTYDDGTTSELTKTAP